MLISLELEQFIFFSGTPKTFNPFLHIYSKRLLLIQKQINRTTSLVGSLQMSINDQKKLNLMKSTIRNYLQKVADQELSELLGNNSYPLLYFFVYRV